VINLINIFAARATVLPASQYVFSINLCFRLKWLFLELWII